MVKETRYRHHPVRIETGLFLGSQQINILGFRLHLLDAALTSAEDQDSTTIPLWKELTLNDLMPTGETIPTDAIAMVFAVEASDSLSGSNLTYMGFCPTGRATPGRCQYVYPGNADATGPAFLDKRKGSRIIIVELSDDTYPSIGYRIVSSDGAFDYSINLIGWLIGGTRVPRLTIPAEDLFCKCAIHHP